MMVCEVGVNHFGDERISKIFIDNLIESKCAAITYQVREKKFYKKYFKDFGLSDEHYSYIIQCIQESNKEFGIALADKDRVNNFCEMDINFFKVLSWDINDHNYIDKLIETGKRVYISTGLATENNLKSLSKRYGNNHHINLIHTQLTHEIIDTNLNAIELMKQYGFDVSYGNHSKNLNTIYVSLAYQPKEIWCYVKLKNSPQQPLDHEHAIETSNINKFIENIIELKKSIGDGRKIKHETKAFNPGLEDIL